MWLTLRLDPAHCGRRRKGLSVVFLKIEFDFDQLRNKYRADREKILAIWSAKHVSFRYA